MKISHRMIRKILAGLFLLLGMVTVAAAQVDADSLLVQAGYRKIPAIYVAGSIASLGSRAIENLVVPNLKAAMQGKMAGVHTVQANGMPSAEVAVRVRGTGSIYGETEPLYVIDGIPVYAGPREIAPEGIGGNWGAVFNPLSDINPMDIASIQVLKDAGAAAIYGARGANGVILITTKNARPNRSDVRLDYYTGITQTTNRVRLLNGPDYLRLLDQAWQNSGQTGEGPLPAVEGFNRATATGVNSDHLSQVLGQGNVQQLSLSASSGTTKSAFYFSGSYRKEAGVLTGNDLTRYTGKVKFTNQLTSKLSINANIGMNYSEYFNMPVGRSEGGGFGAAQRNLPVFPWYHPNGTYFYASDPAVYHLPGSNIMSFMNKNDYDNEEQTKRVFVAAGLGYKVMKGLELRVDAAMDQYYHTRRDYISKRLRYGSVGSGAGREGTPLAYAGYEKYSENVYNLLATLSYKKIKGAHNLSVLGGFEVYYNDNPYFFAEGEGFVSDFLRQPAAAAYRNQITPEALVTNVNVVTGYFATADYVFKERYLLNATVRVDASSRFGADNKYQVFPALSAGYIFSGALKLRASYGWTGNYGIGNYSSLERWGISPSSRYLLQAGVHALGLGSPSLKPEKQEQINIGADFSLLKGRITGSLDIYNRTTKDMILLFPVPLSSGVKEPGLLLNGGAMRNRGIELNIASKNVQGVFTWNTELSIAHNQNKISDLGGLSPDQVSVHKNIVNYTGHAAGVYYLAEYAGVDPATGEELIYDRDRKVVPAVSAAMIDSARIPHFNKPSAPKFFGGLNNIFTYKNFDLSAFITFSYGNYLLDEGERELSYLKGKNNLLATAAQASFPKLRYNDPVAGSNTTRFLHDASYLRMKNLTVGYAIKKIKFLKEARIYLTAQNLFTLTRFPGWDPEVAGSYLTNAERSLNQGITYMDLPQVKSFVAGINVKL